MFKSIFVDNFLPYFEEHPTINLITERIKLNLLFKLSNLNSNFALTLGYLNPALNNPAQYINFSHTTFKKIKKILETHCTSYTVVLSQTNKFTHVIPHFTLK